MDDHEHDEGTHRHNPGEPEFGEHSEDAPHNPGEPEFGEEHDEGDDVTSGDEAAQRADLGHS